MVRGHKLHLLGRHPRVLLQCVKPTTESILDDVLELEIEAAINLAKERVEWKKNRPSRQC